jgi:ADP-glucose pyrophosphorylase
VKHDIKPPQDFFDDYDHAEHDIFQHVENAEKTILTAAGHLIRDEVNYLFSDHQHKKVDEMNGDQQVQRRGRRRGSSVPTKDKKKVKGVNAKKEAALTEHEKKHAWFEQILKDYIENDLE